MQMIGESTCNTRTDTEREREREKEREREREKNTCLCLRTRTVQFRGIVGETMDLREKSICGTKKNFV